MKKSYLKLSCLSLVVLSFMTVPTSLAQNKDLDMADRVYEKYQEREKDKAREEARADRSRNNNAREQSRNNSRQKTPSQNARDNGSRSSSRSEQTRTKQSRNTDRNRSTQTSNARSESRRESEASEDLERFIRNAIGDRDESSRNNEASSDSVARYQRRAQERRSSSRSTSRDRQDVRTTSNEVSLDQAVNMIRRTSDGQVLSAKSSGSKHRIKVLIDGRRVRTYVVDAVTGEIY